MIDHVTIPDTDEAAFIADMAVIALVCDRFEGDPRLPAHLQSDVRNIKHRAINSAERIRRLARQQNTELAGRLAGRGA